jgi:hypothetical protein
MCSGDEERQEHGHHVLLAQTFFPSSICAVVLPIIHLLEDGEVSDDGVAGECESFTGWIFMHMPGNLIKVTGKT